MKSTWTTPQLIVLVDVTPADAVLAFAKGRPGARRCVSVLEDEE